MSPLLLTAFVSMSWFLPTIKAQMCGPYDRLFHPRNCSSYILCDNNSKPKVFHCSPGLHWNRHQKYCDWPERAKCRLVDHSVKGSMMGRSRGNVTVARQDIAKVTLHRTKSERLSNVTSAHRVAMKTQEYENRTSNVENKTVVTENTRNNPKTDAKVENKTVVTENTRNNPKTNAKVENKTVVTENTRNNPKTNAKVSMKTIITREVLRENNSTDSSNRKPTDIKDKPIVNSVKGKTYEKIIVQEKTKDGDSMPEPRVSGKISHKISKRQDKASKNEEMKTTEGKITEVKTLKVNKSLINKSIDEDVLKSSTNIEKNTTEKTLNQTSQGKYANKTESNSSNTSFTDLEMEDIAESKKNKSEKGEQNITDEKMSNASSVLDVKKPKVIEVKNVTLKGTSRGEVLFGPNSTGLNVLNESLTDSVTAPDTSTYIPKFEELEIKTWNPEYVPVGLNLTQLSYGYDENPSATLNMTMEITNASNSSLGGQSETTSVPMAESPVTSEHSPPTVKASPGNSGPSVKSAPLFESAPTSKDGTSKTSPPPEPTIK